MDLPNGTIWLAEKASLKKTRENRQRPCLSGIPVRDHKLRASL
jgi:hypothetical protein